MISCSLKNEDHDHQNLFKFLFEKICRKKHLKKLPVDLF